MSRTDGQDKSVDQLRVDLEKPYAVVSRLSKAETGAMSEAGRPHGDWRVSRIGADPPENPFGSNWRNFRAREVFNAIGIPVGLMSDSTPGTGQREAFQEVRCDASWDVEGC